MKVCIIDGCGSPKWKKSPRYCVKHQRRKDRHGDPFITYAPNRGNTEPLWLYRTWEGMLRRCTNPKHRAFQRYSSLGLSVDWLDYAKFREYILLNIGERPTENHTLDRLDNEKGYYPGNLRWATPAEQMQNTRINVVNEQKVHDMRILYDSGISARELANKFGVSLRNTFCIVRKTSWRNV